MTNIIMLVKDRPRLTIQAINSLERHTKTGTYNVTFIDDGSKRELSERLIKFIEFMPEDYTCLSFARSVGIVGYLRNIGAWTAERHWGRGDYLCFLDNDVYLREGWLEKMISAYEASRDLKVKLLGGYRHPFHGANKNIAVAGVQSIDLTDAVAGYGHFMDWATWDKYGPYDAHAKGVCQSEDFALCQKIIADGGAVGYVNPPVLWNCGITNSEGNPAVGHEAFHREPGLIYE